MAVGEEFERLRLRAEESLGDTGRNGNGREGDRYEAMSAPGGRDRVARAVGSPLPMGSSGKPQGSFQSEASTTRTSVPPPGRALSVPAASDPDHTQGMQWFAGVMKQAIPFVQKLLPLLDGQIASAVANVLTARPHTPAAPRIDLQPIERGVAELQIQQANFKDQLADQNTSLKRVEDQLEQVREATDRNTLEQQELIEDLKTITGKMNRLAIVFGALLVISLLFNIILFLHIQRVLP